MNTTMNWTENGQVAVNRVRKAENDAAFPWDDDGEWKVENRGLDRIDSYLDARRDRRPAIRPGTQARLDHAAMIVRGGRWVPLGHECKGQADCPGYQMAQDYCAICPGIV